MLIWLHATIPCLCMWDLVSLILGTLISLTSLIFHCMLLAWASPTYAIHSNMKPQNEEGSTRVLYSATCAGNNL